MANGLLSNIELDLEKNLIFSAKCSRLDIHASPTGCCLIYFANDVFYLYTFLLHGTRYYSYSELGLVKHETVYLRKLDRTNVLAIWFYLLLCRTQPL